MEECVVNLGTRFYHYYLMCDVEVVKINNNGTFVIKLIAKGGKEYIHNYEDINKILLTKVEKTNKRNSMKYSYEECAGNKNNLKDKTYKDECKQLAKVCNIIYQWVIGDKFSLRKLSEARTYSPSAEELQEIFIERREKKAIHNRLDKNTEILISPYFGCVRMAEMDTENEEDIYIGNTGIFDGYKQYVCDWRSPIAQMYYDKSKLKYIIDGKKYYTKYIRDFDIRNSKLYSYNDSLRIDEKNDVEIASDKFLLDILRSKRNTEEIGNIISTIQQKQNEIIVDGINNNIIVQGCAGSGKTMVLYHRLSRILFNNKQLDKSKIKVITPNKLFKRVMNNLSRELDVDNVEQLCIEEYYIKNLCSYGFKLNENIESNLTYYGLNTDIYNYFFSESYVEELYVLYRKIIEEILNTYEVEAYLKYGKEHGLEYVGSENPNEQIAKLKSYIGIIKTKLQEEKGALSERYKNLEEYCTSTIREKQEMNKKIKILEEVGVLRRKRSQIMYLFNRSEINREIYSKLKENFNIIDTDIDINIMLRDFRINAKDAEEMQRKATKQSEEVKIKINYITKMINYQLDEFAIIKSMYWKSRKSIFSKFNQENINKTLRVDLYSLLYLAYINKGELIIKDKLLLIDEGQNLNLYEYKLMKLINGDKLVFNILGDTKQLTYDFTGIRDWSSLSSVAHFKQYELNENYRNSSKITKYCNEKFNLDMIAIGKDEGRVVATSKEEVGIIFEMFKKSKGLRKSIIVKEINDDTKKIIEKYMVKDSVNYLKDYIDGGIDIKKYNVYSVELVKGLEFDTVITILDSMNSNEKYIATTRALYECYVIES